MFFVWQTIKFYLRFIYLNSPSLLGKTRFLTCAELNDYRYTTMTNRCMMMVYKSIVTVYDEGGEAGIVGWLLHTTIWLYSQMGE